MSKKKKPSTSYKNRKGSGIGRLTKALKGKASRKKSKKKKPGLPKLVAPVEKVSPRHATLEMKRVLSEMDFSDVPEKTIKAASLTAGMMARLRNAGLLSPIQRGQYTGLSRSSSGPVHAIPEELSRLGFSPGEYSRLVRHIEGRAASANARQGLREIGGINRAGEMGVITEPQATQLMSGVPFLQNL